MAKVALVLSLIALVVAIMAYQKAGGSGGVQDNVKALQSALEVMRRETADALSRIERSVRPNDRSQEAPAKPKP